MSPPGPSRAARALLALAAVVLVGAVAWVPARTVRAQGADGASGASLALVRQTDWVGPEGTFEVVVRGRGLPAGASVRGELHARVDSRDRLHQVLDDGDVGDTIFRTPVQEPLAEVTGNDGTLTVRLPVTAGPATFGVAQLSGSGVYPFVVRVDTPDGLVATLTTTLLRLGSDTTDTPLAVGVVVPVTARPALAMDGTPYLDDPSAERLDELTTVLARPRIVPVAVDPSPEVLQLLAQRDPAGEAAVARLVDPGSDTPGEVMAEPYAPVDLGAFVDRGLDAELDRQFATGTTTVTELLGAAPEGRRAVVGPSVTTDALRRLVDLGVEAVVVPSDQVAPLGSATATADFADRFNLTAGAGTTLDAVVADTVVTARLADRRDPLLAAHAALAELAVTELVQRPGAHGTAVLVPPDVDPDTLAELLAALGDPTGTTSGSAGAPFVAPVGTAQLFAAVPEADSSTRGRTTTLEREYRSPPPADLGGYPDRLRTTEGRVGGLHSLVPGADALTDPLDRLLLSSGSRLLEPAQRDGVLDAVDATVTDLTGEIVVTPEQIVTLTSSSGRVPLNLENRLSVPARVRLVLSSAKLDFPEGAVLEETLAANTTTRVDLAVETKASGAFPLDVTISSADGVLPVASTRYTVRSTAISGVGLVLSIGAGAFLLFWWARHFRTSRRARKLVATNHPALSGPDPGSYAPPHADPLEGR